jgi:hypothetical protein
VDLPGALARIASLAAAHAEENESVGGVIAAEPITGGRVYLCAFERGDEHTWLALDDDGMPVESRELVREVASLAALCEIAEETAGGGQLEELRSSLLQLRLTEAPVGIEEAEAAALALEQTIGSPPRVASPGFLDAVGAATRRLEHALGDSTRSPFATAMQQAAGTADEFAAEVAARYKRELR